MTQQQDEDREDRVPDDGSDTAMVVVPKAAAELITRRMTYMATALARTTGLQDCHRAKLLARAATHAGPWDGDITRFVGLRAGTSGSSRRGAVILFATADYEIEVPLEA